MPSYVSFDAQQSVGQSSNKRVGIEEVSRVRIIGSISHDKELDEEDTVQYACKRLDVCMEENGKQAMGIFCGIKECSMKKILNGGLVPYRSSLKIVSSMIHDDRIHMLLSISRWHRLYIGKRRRRT